MCGIVAYIGKKNATPILINGLKRLEYRGYDSAGCSILSDGQFNFVKKSGRVKELEKEVEQQSLKGSLGISHTRWATHGSPNEINAHPHWCCKQNIFLVHNGIIENYATLKEWLGERGHEFISETDSVGSDTGLILLSPEGFITERKAGAFIDEMISNNGVVKRRTADGRMVEYSAVNDWRALASTNDGKLKFGRIKWAIRKERGNKPMINIRSATGDITITKDHSVYEYKDGYINPGSADNLDNVVSIRRMPNIEKVKEINLIKLGNNKKLNSCLKVFGYFSKAKLDEFLKNNPRFRKYAYPLLDNHQKELNRRGRVSLPLTEAVRLNIPKEYLRYFNISSRNGHAKIPTVIPLDENLGKMLGFFLSEGSSKLKKGVHINKKECLVADVVFCNNQNEEIIKEAADAVSQVFSFSPSIVKSMEKSGGVTKKVCASRIAIYHLLQNILKCGERCDTKVIPTEILNARKEVKKAFLHAYFLGDGSERHQQISTTSKDIRDGLKLLYWQLDIPVSSHFVGKTITGKSEYVVANHKINNKSKTTPGDFDQYFSWSEFIQRIHNDVCYGNAKVAPANYEKEKYIYDIEVNPSHNFVTSEGLICHNTEVIAHLIEEHNNGDLLKAVQKALSLVDGTYGLGIISKHEPNTLIGARKGSPLAVGVVKNGEYILASDPAAIIEHTKKVIYLDDGEIVKLTRKGMNITNLENKKVQKQAQEIQWDLEQIEKAGFNHFMLKEIYEQPQTIENAIRGRALPQENRIQLGGIQDWLDFLTNVKRVVFLACGTSWHAGLIGEYLFEHIAGIPAEAEYASEFRYKSVPIDKRTAYFVISQSGETADTLESLHKIKKGGAKVFGIVNVVGSSIARETDAGVYLHAGPEIGVASTKAFTSQVTVLSQLAILLGVHKGKVAPKEVRSRIDALVTIPSQVQQILDQNEKIKQLAKKYYKFNNFLYLGRGFNFPTALEGALKLKEISYIHAEGYPAAEMKHGPIALIDENMPVVVIATDTEDVIYQKVVSNIEEVKARSGNIIAVATEGNTGIKDLATEVIYVPKTNGYLTPLLNVIPLQLLAYHMAVLRSCDVDKPRNLAKSVTVE